MRGMSTTETIVEPQLIWGCVGHNPTRWALGEPVGNRLSNVRACVVRFSTGSWGWAVFDQSGKAEPDRRGVEPSRDTAMFAAEVEILQMTKP